MAVLNIHFLGIANLTIDDIPIHLERRNSLALLAYLVLTNRPHTRDELATLLAGDVGDGPARKLLRNALADLVEHGLRDYLHTNRQTVAFNTASPYTLDITTLDELSAAGDLATPDELAWASDRCDWELLSGLGAREAPDFELWLLGERERRGQQLRELAQRHLSTLLASEQIEAGIGLARRLLVVEPWNEAVHCSLMRLHARAGQVANALAQYDRCRAALADELGVEPQSETTALFERLRAGPVNPRHNLPATIAEGMIGRDEQLNTVCTNLIDPDCRLLTIVGLGGSGKTSLALAAATQLTSPAPEGDDHPFADGVIFVNMADIPDAEGPSDIENSTSQRISTVIGFALGLAFYGHIDRLEQVIAYLQPKRILLVLDDMDHLRSETSTLLAILAQCPGVTILATSRHALGIAEEWTHEPGGLPTPDTVDELEQAAASRLFLREARRMNVQLTAEDMPAVVQVCRLAGGWPLAIKVAAGWLGTLACADIARELEQGGALLNEPVPGASEGLDSIRAIVASSYDALSEPDRKALTRLAVFSGPFRRQAAEAVGVTSERLVALDQRSLLERRDRNSYMLHPLVSQYASAQLSRDSCDENAARGDHATYYANLVSDALPSLFTNSDAHTLIGVKRANIHAAWDWAVAQQNVELLGQLCEGLAVWYEQAGLHREWTAWLSAAISRFRNDHDDPTRETMLVKLLVAKADSLLWQGDLDGAFPLLEESRLHAARIGALDLDAAISFCEGRLLRFRGGGTTTATEVLKQALILARATRQRRIEADSLLQLSFAATERENFREAESFLDRAEDAFRTIGDRLSLAKATNHRGRLAVYRGDYTRAQVDLEQSMHTAQTFGDRFLEGYSRLYLGIVSDVAFGRHVEAGEHFELAFAIAGQTGNPYFEGNLHRAYGRNALHTGDFTAAEQSFNHAIERARDVGNYRAINDSLLCLAELARSKGDYVTAEDRARQALHLSTEQRRRRATAAALLCLGQTSDRQDRLSSATDWYTKAVELVDGLGIPYLRCEARVGLASVSLAGGNICAAVRYVDEVLSYLRRHELAGCEEPGWIIDTCYRVLATAGDDRAGELLRLGAELLHRRESALPETEHSRYLTAFPERNAVLRRWHELSGHVDASSGSKTPLAASSPPYQRSGTRPTREQHGQSFAHQTERSRRIHR